MESDSHLSAAASEACLIRSRALNASEVQLALEGSAAGLDNANPWLGYHHVPQATQQAWREMSARMGNDAFSDFLRMLVVRYIEQFDIRFRASEIPPPFVPEFGRVFDRMLRTIVDGSFDADPESHVFLKDLAISRLRLIPCVSHVVYRHSGVPRRALVLQSPRRIPEIVSFFRRAGGFKPFLENHVHPAMLEDFNPEGRSRCYQLVAELLRSWPDFKGLLGASWYYDPQLAQISPNLAYLYEEPVRAGALVLHVGNEGPDSGALARSKRRQQLYESGSYMPKTYLMLWARKDILGYVG